MLQTKTWTTSRNPNAFLLYLTELLEVNLSWRWVSSLSRFISDWDSWTEKTHTHTLRFIVHALRLVECTMHRSRHLRDVMKFTLFSPLPPVWISAFRWPGLTGNTLSSSSSSFLCKKKKSSTTLVNNTARIVLHFLMIMGFWCSL